MLWAHSSALWGELLLAAYFAVLLTLAIFGLHRYRMVYLYFRHRHRQPKPAGRFPEPLRVTVQLPLYNELSVAYAASRGLYASLPFLLLFQTGFLYTGTLSLRERFERRFQLIGAARALDLKG